MKKSGFIKTALVGGLFVLMPVVVVVVLVGKAFGMLGNLAAAVAARAPQGLDHLPLATGLTVVFLVGLSYALGRFVLPKRDPSGAPVERALLNRIPGYQVLRGIALSLFGFEGVAAVKPALLRREEGVAEVVLAVEALPGDRHVIFLPECPVPMTGSLLVVDDRLLEFLPASSVSVLRMFSGWGGGAAEVLAPKPAKSSD